MSLVTISSMLSKTITTWSLSSFLFSNCCKYLESSYDLLLTLVHKKNVKVIGKNNYQIFNKHNKLFVEAREGTHIQFLYQIFFFYMIVNLWENFIYNPGQSKPSKKYYNTSAQMKLYSMSFWLDIYQSVANSLFFTFSKNQRVYYFSNWSIALTNCRSHVIISF